MRIGIMTNEQFENQPKNSVGSTRIRCSWLLPLWPEAEEFRIGTRYDAVIYQKAYFHEHMRVFKGVKILDLCDPDWGHGRPVIQCAELCDAVTVSSKGLHEYLSRILSKPVFLVPDRVNMDFHREKKAHAGRAKSAVWFGYHHNQSVLDGVLPTLKRLGLDLTVVSDQPYFPAASVQGIDKDWITAHVKNVKYDAETANEEIVAGGDFLLNNRPETGKFYYKSDNKTVIGWALGMPVARNADDVERFMDADERVKEAEARLAEVADLWTSDKSVREYQDVIRRIQEGRSA